MNSAEAAELQLQQELKILFEVDTQKDLEIYLELVTQLQDSTWKKDIQSLYRSIHTIKGGAVTVGADAILYVATALEDLLSQLRYLETPPPLGDGHLREILQEAGEILASVISFPGSPTETKAAVQPQVERIQQLGFEVEQIYLPNWNEELQLQREFAEQGFDLVVLDLEMAIDSLEEVIPPETIALGQETLNQLHEIGEQILLGQSWSALLEKAQLLLNQPDPLLWQQQWPNYFQQLKTCAKTGGQNPLASTSDHTQNLFSDDSDLDAGDLGDILAELNQPTLFSVDLMATDLIPEEDFEETTDLKSEEITQIGEFLEEFNHVSPPASQPNLPTPEKIQIPVPLERIERSSQYLIDTILTLRATKSYSQNLNSQLRRLVNLAKESFSQITDLRQLQDDFALLDNLKKEALQGPNLESYRKGYTTINRLLENILRLQELGAETEQIAIHTQEQLQQLDRNVVQLRSTVQDSRLTSFRDLSFKARAILRDLTLRYGKAATMIVQNEHLQLDVRTARSLEPVLLHLIRNAYDHAIELPEERISKGKPVQATITLGLERIGSSFIMSLKDDGRGINATSVEHKAKTLNLPLTDTSTEEKLLAVLCQPGFSSQSQVSELSGRGVGLDVVATQIASLGGQLSLETTLDRGSCFYLKLPVPYLLMPCTLLEVGDRRSGITPLTFAVPSEQVVTTALLTHLNSLKYDSEEGSWQIKDNQTITSKNNLDSNSQLPPYSFDLINYWNPSLKRAYNENTVCIYVVEPHSKQGIWLIADKLLGQSELPIMPIPSPVIPPLGLMGMSLQPDGRLLPVLEIRDFVKKVLSAGLNGDGPTESVDLASPEQPLSEFNGDRSILIVDDAALMRRRLEVSLSANGYIINTCADGLDAWNWLQNNPSPALIITDLEMPHMDGFTLIERCRQIGLTMPILVISSRLAEEWSTEAQQIGANDYLTKGFSTAELLNKVNGILNNNN